MESDQPKNEKRELAPIEWPAIAYLVVISNDHDRLYVAPPRDEEEEYQCQYYYVYTTKEAAQQSKPVDRRTAVIAATPLRCKYLFERQPTPNHDCWIHVYRQGNCARVSGRGGRRTSHERILRRESSIGCEA